MEAYMKRRYLILAFLLLMVSALLFAQEWTAAQKEVWGVEQKFSAALLRGDVEGFMSLMHPDYRGLNHGTSLPIDKATFRKGAEENVKNSKITFLSFQPLAVQVFGTG